jgi:phage terminase large subunit-like protein
VKVGNAPKSGGKLPPDVVEILKDPETKKKFLTLKPEQQVAWAWRMRWLQQAHKHQILPAGDWYSIWLLLAGRGAGKQLCVDTPIPTPSGWVRNGDLKGGDLVFDERGNVCSVVQAHPISMPKTAYRLTFNDGSVIDADGEHLWSTMTHRARKQMTRHGIKRVPDDWATYRHPIINCHQTVMGYVGSEVLTTQQIKGTLTQGRRGDLNHCVPTAQPLNLPEADLPIDPYLLGSWLGDGSSKDQAIWGHAEDIGLIESHAQSLGYETVRKHDQGNTWSVRVIGLAKQLKSLGILGNKHVPQAYLRSSIDQRLALLQGLMDTDGYQDAKLAEFCNTNQRLADSVYELAVSLGEKPVLKESRAMLHGRDCGEKYRVTWRWNRFNPFRMARKRDRLAAPEGQSFKHGHRMIVLVEEIASKPMRCITVDSPSRLYLAGEAMIPTHNTRTAAEQIGWMAWTNPGTRSLVAAPTSSDVRATCFEGDSGLMSVIPQALISEYNKALHEIRLINGSLIKGIPASEPERFRGPQFHFAWADELAAWEYLQEAWDQIQFGLRLGKRTIMICTTTPRPKDLIIDLIGRDGDDVAVTTASTYANLDNLSANFRKQILQYEGTTLGRQEIYAEIIDPEEGGIVKRDMFRLWPDGKPFPKFEYIIQSYDVATSEKVQNDPTACITFGVFKPLDGPMAVMVIDCWQERLQYPDLRPKVIEEYGAVYGEGKEKKRVDLLLIEDKSAGISLIQDLQRAHLPIRAYNPGRADKLQRLNIVSNIIARGRVWIPESNTRKGYVRDWAEGFVSQICSFPHSTLDDLTDCCTQALRFLRDSGWLEIDPPPDDDWDEDDYVDSGRSRRRENPYAQ